MPRCRITSNKLKKVKVFFIQVETGRAAVRTRNGIIPWTHVVAQDMLGRELKKSERVHHLNHDCSDDRPENLEILTKKEHDAHHKEVNWGDVC